MTRFTNFLPSPRSPVTSLAGQRTASLGEGRLQRASQGEVEVRIGPTPHGSGAVWAALIENLDLERGDGEARREKRQSLAGA